MRHLYTVICTAIFIINSGLSHAQEFRVQLAAYTQNVPFTTFAFSGINNVYKNLDQNGIHVIILDIVFHLLKWRKKLEKSLSNEVLPMLK